MFIKKKIILALFVLTTIFMMACSNKKTKVLEAKPITAKIENIQINWEEVREDFEEALNENPAYPHGKYVDFAVYPEKNIIRLIWPLDNEISQVDSLAYARDMIKIFNNIVHTQDFSIELANEDYYGGLWDRYNLELELFNEVDIMEPDLYYVNQYIPAKSNDPVIPQIIGENSKKSENTNN